MALAGVRVLGLMGFWPEPRWELAKSLAEDGWLLWPFREPIHRALYQLNPMIVDEGIPGYFDDFQGLLARKRARREDADGAVSFIQLAEELRATYPGVRRLTDHGMPLWARESTGLQNLWVDQWRAAAEEDLKNGKSLVVPDVETEAQAEAIRAIAMSPFSKIARITSSGSGREENELAAAWPGDVSVRDEGEGLEILKDSLLEAITPRRAQEYADPDPDPPEDPEPTPASPDPETAP